MKKIFSTVAMAVVAMTAVVTMSSCQNDSPSSFNAAPQMPSTTNTHQTTNQTTSSASQKKDYTYNLSLSDDLLAIFDVQTTVTAGTESKTFTSADFTKATTIKDDFGAVKESGKAIAPYTVKVDNAESVKVMTTVTLKSNWKEILDGMNKKEYDFFYEINHSMVSGAGQSASKCTEDYLKSLAGRLSNSLSD